MAVRVARHRHREVNPHDRAAVLEVALLEAHRVEPALVQARALRVGEVAVLRMRDLLHRAADQLLFRVAEDLAQAAVHLHEAAGKIDVGDARGRELESVPEALLALAQRRLRLLAAGDVDNRAHQAGDVAAAVRESRLVVDRVAHAAVARGDRGLVALAAGPAPELAVHLEVLLRNRRALRIEVLDELAEEARARQAEELLPGLVDAEVLAVAALEEHRHG